MLQNKRTKREQLELFVRRAEELRQTNYVRSFSTRNELSSHLYHATMVSDNSEEPNEEHFRSFLLTFRQFWSDDEDIFFYKICNICYQSLSDKEKQEQVAHIRQFWKEALNNVTGIGLGVEKTLLDAEHIINLWINGYYFHNDKDKVERVEHLASLPIPADRIIFLLAIHDLAKAIFRLAKLINDGIQSNMFIFTDETST